MPAKDNRKGERDKESEGMNKKNLYFTGVDQNKKIFENKEKEKNTEKETENVILMGAPKPKKKVSKIGLKAKIPSRFTRTGTSSKEEKPAKATGNVANKNGGSHINLGRVFLGLTALLIAFLILGDSLDWFGSVDIKFLSLWPLVFIFVGLLLFKVKTRSGKIFGVFAVLIVLLASLSILMLGDRVVNVVLSGDIVVEERDIDDFEKLIFEGVGDIEIIQGDKTSLVLESDKNVLDQIVTQSIDGVLTISYKSPVWRLFLFDVAKVTITLTSPAYSGIYIIGSGNVVGSSLKSDNLLLSISGSGSVEIDDLEVGTLTSEIAGSGDFVLSGRVQRQVVSITGSGSYVADNLLSSETGVRIYGSGEVTVKAEKLLDVSIEGSGQVLYAGSPSLREGSISGSGSIKALSDTEKSINEESKTEMDPDEF